MIRIEDECVGCLIPCIDCGRKRVPHYYCDICDEDIAYDDGMYNVDGQMVCHDCLCKMFKANPEDFD